LGSHLLWLIAVYAASIYVEVPEPNAMVVTLAGGFGLMLLVSERPAVATWWLGGAGSGVAGSGAGNLVRGATRIRRRRAGLDVDARVGVPDHQIQ
jgi:hypothetical protein